MLKSLVTGFLHDQIKAQATKSLGIDEATFDAIAGDALDSIIVKTASNVNSTDGAASFINALQKDHDGSLLDNIAGLIDQEQPGSKILDHILGGQKSVVETQSAAHAGSTLEKTSSLFNTIALIFMQVMGKQLKDGNLDGSKITSMFTQEKKAVTDQLTAGGSASPQNPLLTMLLDGDGDNDVDAKDLISLAGKFLK